MRRSESLARLVLVALVATCGVAHGATALHVRSKSVIRAFVFGNTELTTDEWTCADRRLEDMVGVTRDWPHSDSTATHRRVITRLDRQVVWTIDLADSSYTEDPLRRAGELERLIDSVNVGLDLPTPPTMKLVVDTLGVGERVIGVPVTHVSRKWSSAQQPAGITELESWEARATPGLDLHRGFEVRLDSLRKPPAGSTSSAGGFEAARRGEAGAGLLDRRFGLTLRAVGRIKGRDAPSEADSAFAEDPESQSMGFEPGTGALRIYELEVVQLGLAEAGNDLFELPRGLKRKPSPDEMLLKSLREASAFDQAPAATKK